MTALRVEGEHRINIVQGEYHVTADPRVVLTTLLGSCVAACIRDPQAGVGGINHFLLPGQGSAVDRQIRVLLRPSHGASGQRAFETWGPP